MTERIEALKSGIEKWIAIQNSELTLSAGCGLCALCKLYRTVVYTNKPCPDCPLTKINRCCLYKSSGCVGYLDYCENLDQVPGLENYTLAQAYEERICEVDVLDKLEECIDQMIIDLELSMVHEKKN